MVSKSIFVMGERIFILLYRVLKEEDGNVFFWKLKLIEIIYNNNFHPCKLNYSVFDDFSLIQIVHRFKLIFDTNIIDKSQFEIVPIK